MPSVKVHLAKVLFPKAALIFLLFRICSLKDILFILVKTLRVVLFNRNYLLFPTIVSMKPVSL